MEIYKIVIIVVAVYIIIYNLTLGFSLFNKKHTIVIHDCDTEDLQTLGFQHVINRYPANTINIEYDKDNKTATIREAFDMLLITGIEGVKRVQIDRTVYNGISDSFMVTKLPIIDLRIEGGFKKQEISGLHENTLLTFPDKKNLFRIKEADDEDFLYIFKGGKTKVLNIVFIE